MNRGVILALAVITLVICTQIDIASTGRRTPLLRTIDRFVAITSVTTGIERCLSLHPVASPSPVSVRNEDDHDQ